MRLTVLAVGRMKPGPDAELAERYLARASALSARLGFSGPEIRDFAQSRLRTADARMQAEATILHGAVPGGARLIVLDEKGSSLSSIDFAARLAGWRDTGVRDAAFLIGGPDGIAPQLLAGAALTLSLSAMTLPHQLARILLCEQIYRALTILSGHPYHREG